MHEGQEVAVETNRGVRQGCRAAPGLWGCYTLSLMERLAELLTKPWVLDTLTFFADDIHCGDLFYNEEQLRECLRRFGVLLDELEGLGMKLSLSKSCILLTIGGTNCRHVLPALLCKNATGTYIEIPRETGFSRLPVKTRAKYLGVEISYQFFEMDTLNLRIHTAKTAFHRLRKWLCSKRIRLQDRLQLWQSCVLSTLTFGLFAAPGASAWTGAVAPPAGPSAAELDGGLQEHHLTHLLSQPFGTDLLRIIRQHAWEDLLQYPEALNRCNGFEHIVCVLCNIRSFRVQEYNQHLRTYHNNLLQNVFTKAAQIVKAHAMISRCRLCTKTFVKGRMCPVAIQLALILVNLNPTGAGRDHIHPAVLRCEICQESFDDLPAMCRHLQEIHNLEFQDWDAARDLMGQDAACAHCCRCFPNKAAVRQHVTLGHCPDFDPLRPPFEQPVPQDWQDLLRSGDIGSLHQAPMKRLALTLTCQMCSMKFPRQGDLSLHLQTVHAKTWNQTLMHARLLMQVYQSDASCFCNPSSTQRGGTHNCVSLRQLGMLAPRCVDVFIPWTFTAAGLSAFCTAMPQTPVLAALCDAVLNRQFTRLWNDPMFKTLLSAQCLQCGSHFHSMELRDHVHQQHASSAELVAALTPVLLTAFQTDAPTDFQCAFCQQIFNLPPTGAETPDEHCARRLLAQIHLQHQCPVFLQICHLLSHGCLGCQYAGPGGERRNVGGLQGDGATLRTLQLQPRSRKRCQEAQGPRTRCSSQSSNFTGRRRKNHAGNGPPDQEQQVWKRQDCWVCYLQANSQAVLPVLMDQAKRWHQARSEVTEPPQDMNLPLRCFLIQKLAEVFLDRLTQLSKCDSQDKLLLTAKKHGILNQDNQFPFQRWCHKAQALQTVGQPPVTMQRMLKYATQFQQPAERQEPLEGQGQEQVTFSLDAATLRRGFLTLRLAHDSTWCYSNAAFLTTMWAMLCCSEFTPEFWGPRFHDIARLLMTNDSTPVQLSDLDWGVALLTHWRSLHRQGDPVEFLSHMLQGLNLAGYDNTWERRVQVGVQTEVLDKSDRYTPLVLQFDPEHFHDDTAQLQVMISDWASHTVVKSDKHLFFQWEVTLPVFVDSSTAVSWQVFQFVAAVAHIGQDNAGHCRGLLRIHPIDTVTDRRAMFLLTEDWEQPQRIWDVPNWFVRNVTCIWLCAKDKFCLHHMPSLIRTLTTTAPDDRHVHREGLHSGSGQPATDDLLAMFAPTTT
eukprot:s4108_g4.t1